MSITRRIHSFADMEENVGDLIITKHKIRASGHFQSGKLSTRIRYFARM